MKTPHVFTFPTGENKPESALRVPPLAAAEKPAYLHDAKCCLNLWSSLASCSVKDCSRDLSHELKCPAPGTNIRIVLVRYPAPINSATKPSRNGDAGVDFICDSQRGWEHTVDNMGLSFFRGAGDRRRGESLQHYADTVPLLGAGILLIVNRILVVPAIAAPHNNLLC